jgi:glyoxylase-like metal-dependent hydrolase (beta-lactamase superfamily II)
MVKTQAPGFYRAMVGDFELTVLSDGTNPLPATRLLQGDSAQIAEALKANFLTETVETSHNSFLINTGSKLVLVDAGAGTMLGPHTGDLLNNLRAAGYRPEQIDEIYLTHLHTDHVGGLVENGRRVFPNATVRVDKREVEYWLSETNAQAAPEAAKRFFLAAAAALTPYQQAGALKPFDGNTDLIPGVRAQSGYGHTPGHTTYAVESRGQKLLLWGDVVHVAAVQFEHPSVTIGYDVDAGEAKHEHDLALADAAREGYLIGGAHMSFPGLGHVRQVGEDAYAFVPINYSSMK